jgi:uncharacterized protein YggU (UPF0235/DUF167 family)
LLTRTPEGLSLAVRVMPRAGVSKVAGVRDGRLLIRLAAAPVDGAANQALLTFLAKALGIPPRDITLAAGQQGRNKRIVLMGITLEEAETRMRRLIPD